MKVRQKEIAEKTGFSINTVSLALKGSPRISAETRDKILDIARSLNYIPNQVAQSLVQKRTHTIGVLLTRIQDPILAVVSQQIERKLAAEGYSMLLMLSNNNPQYENQALDVLISRQVDGILMYPVLCDNLTKIYALRANNHPIILLGSAARNAQCETVYVDSWAGAFKAVDHLARLGHRQIALIDGSISGNQEKFKGYQEALAGWGCAFEPELVVLANGIGYEQGYYGAAELFRSRKPTAIFAGSDHLALGAMAWCREHGVKVPDEVAIIGFNNVEAAKFSEVPLTSVNYNVDELTDNATALLFDLIHQKGPLSELTPQKIPIEPGLLIRESCGAKLRRLPSPE
jgi:LacI family transcriptional regulator